MFDWPAKAVQDPGRGPGVRRQVADGLPLNFGNNFKYIIPLTADNCQSTSC